LETCCTFMKAGSSSFSRHKRWKASTLNCCHAVQKVIAVLCSLLEGVLKFLRSSSGVNDSLRF
jgi:hypothetical protein